MCFNIDRIVVVVVVDECDLRRLENASLRNTMQRPSNATHPAVGLFPATFSLRDHDEKVKRTVNETWRTARGGREKGGIKTEKRGGSEKEHGHYHRATAEPRP